jgi:hypothetical protein
MHIIVELEIQKEDYSPYTRNRDIDDAKESYSHKEEIIGLHVSMDNIETQSNGIRDKKEHVTRRNLQREA